jgi:hypothetical protein
VSTLLLSDDQVLLAEGENELQSSLNSLNLTTQDYNLEISTKKNLKLQKTARNTYNTNE